MALLLVSICRFGAGLGLSNPDVTFEKDQDEDRIEQRLCRYEEVGRETRVHERSQKAAPDGREDQHPPPSEFLSSQEQQDPEDQKGKGHGASIFPPGGPANVIGLVRYDGAGANELDDACDVKGHHNVLFYGSYARGLRQFAQLYGIKVVT